MLEIDLFIFDYLRPQHHDLWCGISLSVWLRVFNLQKAQPL